MRAYVLWREGVFALLERDPSVGFIAASAYIPAASAAEGGGFAARPGALVVRVPLIGCMARCLARLGRFVPAAVCGLTVSRTSAAKWERRATAARLAAFATGAFANAGEGLPPKASPYTGYDFSRPFPLARFLEVQVPEAVLYAPASAFSLAESPRTLFLRSPAVGVSEEVLYLAVIGVEPHRVETIRLGEPGTGLWAAPPPVRCAFGFLHEIDPARFLRITFEAAPGGRLSAFTFLSATSTGAALCQHAALAIEGSDDR